MATALDIALAYIGRGWNPVPVPHQSKIPQGEGWQRRIIDAASVTQHFNGGPSNVGVIMGASSGGLTDIDLDCAEAIAIAPYVLPSTKAIFGRQSKRNSHWLYNTDLAVTVDVAAVQLHDPTDGSMLLELRIGGGGKGAQTVFPGSTHVGGELIRWEVDGEPASVDGSELKRKVCQVGAFTLIARHWPKGESNRHDLARVVGGFLARCGFTSNQAKTSMTAIARAAADEEAADRAKAAYDAVAGFESGTNTYGFPKLAQAFGAEVATKVADWLGYSGAKADDPSAENTPPAPPILRCHWEPSNEPLIMWLVKKMIPEVGIGRISGQWGTYKTFVTLELAGAIMTGGTFLGRMVKRQGGVLFIAAEGHSQLNVRFAALCTKLGKPKEELPFVSVGTCPCLLDKDAAQHIVAIVREAAAKVREKFDLPLVMVAIDTIAAAAGYAAGQEDDSGVAQIINKALMTVAIETNTFVFGLDHFGKAIETGTRGSSAKEDGVDVVLALLGEKSITGKVTNTRRAVRKLRSADAGEEYAFSVDKVDLGIDEDGEPETSLTVDWNATAAAAAKATDDKWPKGLRMLRQALLNATALAGKEQRPFPDGPLVRAVDTEVVRSEFYKTHPALDGTPKQRQDAKRQAFNRAIKEAQARKAVGLHADSDGATVIWLADPGVGQRDIS